MEKKLPRKWLVLLKKRLERDEKKIKKQIEELKTGDPFADPDHVIDNAAVDTDVREQLGHETVQAQIKELEKRMVDIERALGRMRKGKYGICRKCRKTISIERLKLLPEARHCIKCEQNLYG